MQRPAITARRLPLCRLDKSRLDFTNVHSTSTLRAQSHKEKKISFFNSLYTNYNYFKHSQVATQSKTPTPVNSLGQGGGATDGSRPHVVANMQRKSHRRCGGPAVRLGCFVPKCWRMCHNKCVSADVLPCTPDST